MTFTLAQDLASHVDIPNDGIISKTLQQDDRTKVVLFGFAPGQELSEHTASVPAILHFLQGEAHVTLGATAHELSAGGWVHMPASLPHSIRAKTAVKMLLILLKAPQGDEPR
jgi:quercetin dioxygenase-like cupin family protein